MQSLINTPYEPSLYTPVQQRSPPYQWDTPDQHNIIQKYMKYGDKDNGNRISKNYDRNKHTATLERKEPTPPKIYKVNMRKTKSVENPKTTSTRTGLPSANSVVPMKSLTLIE